MELGVDRSNTVNESFMHPLLSLKLNKSKFFRQSLLEPQDIFCTQFRVSVSVGAMGAAAPTLLSERLFCPHRNPLKSCEYSGGLAQIDGI